MTTLNLKEAAAYLNMHHVTLLLKAQKGEVPAAKPAKRWVFIQQDLLEYLRSLYLNGSKINGGNDNKKPLDNLTAQSILNISQGFGSKKSYYQSLGIADCPQIHSPQPDPRSGACHADGANQVAKGEAVGLVVNSANVPQSKARMM